MNFCSCACLYISLCIEVFGSLFLSLVWKTQANHWTKLIERKPPPGGSSIKALLFSIQNQLQFSSVHSHLFFEVTVLFSFFIAFFH